MSLTGPLPPVYPIPVVRPTGRATRRTVLLGCAGLFVLGLLLAAGGTIALPVGGAISLLWPAVAVQFVAGILFGWPGVAVGTLFPVFSNLLVADAATALLFTPANFLQSALPFYLLRRMGVDPSLRRLGDVVRFALLAALAALGAALLGTLGLVVKGTPWGEATKLGQVWAVTNAVVGFFLAWPLLRFLVPTLWEVSGLESRTGRSSFGRHLLGALFTAATAPVGFSVLLHLAHHRGLLQDLASEPGLLGVFVLLLTAVMVRATWALLTQPLERLLADTEKSAGDELPAPRAPESAELALLREHIRSLAQRLAREQGLFREVFRTAGEPILLVDPKGRLVDANPAFERVFGVSVARAKGRNLVSFNNLESRRALRQFLQAGPAPKPVTFRTRARTAWGKDTVLHLTAAPLRGSGGELAGYCVVIADITTEEERQRRELAAQRLVSLQSLAQGIAHELNNQLQAMQNQLELWPDQPEEARGRVAKLGELVAETGQLVQRLQLLARRGEWVDQQVFNAAELLVGVNRAAALFPARPVAVELVTLLPEIRGNRKLLCHATAEVVRNALEATAAGGEVRVRFFPAPEPPPELGLAQGRYAVFEVADTGPGMRAEELAQAWEPFFTTRDRSQHQGLGLTLAKQAAEHAGGALTITSTPGKGTVVRLWLPAVAWQEPAPPPAAPAAGARLLVVDDEPTILQSLATLLGSLGFEVLVADSGVRALELASEQPPDAVILDLLMPEMPGLQVLQALRQRFPELPVLLASGYAPDEQVHQAMALPRTAFLQKPFTLVQLEQTLAQLLSARE